MATKSHSSLTIKAVIALGQALIAVADRFPTRFLTERDFFPLVVAYLSGRVPDLQAEVAVKEGDVDFRTGGPNPALLELAVAPREFRDARRSCLKFPGHTTALQLYAGQNIKELKKLFLVEQTRAKNRYLLLLDLRNAHNLQKLAKSYRQEARKLTRKGPVRVVYVSYARQHAILLGLRIPDEKN